MTAHEPAFDPGLLIDVATAYLFDAEPSLMNKGNSTIEPTDGDIQRLADLWGTCL